MFCHAILLKSAFEFDLDLFGHILRSAAALGRLRGIQLLERLLNLEIRKQVRQVVGIGGQLYLLLSLRASSLDLLSQHIENPL